MALLNTNIGPERVQAFDRPIGNVSIAGAGISSASFLISTAKTGAPTAATVVASFDEFVDLFGDADDVADDGYYAVKGYYDNAGSGNQAVIVNVGQGAKEDTDITTVADVASSLNSKYFLINSAYDRTMYYVWFSVADAGVDPALTGKTGVKVDIATNASSAAVATALEAALSAVSDFDTSVAGSTVTAINAVGGPATDASDGAAPTAFTIAVMTQGARPTATDYIGDSAAGTGLRALDVIDNVGLITVPGLPLSTAYLVHGSLIDYSETIRTEFGATLSTCFSLVAVPKEITKANTDVTFASDLTISAILGLVVTLAGEDLTGITPGMIVKKAGAFKAVVTAVNVGSDTLTLSTVSGLAATDVITVHMPSAITYKDQVVNNPSRVSAWYYNPVLVLDEASTAESGSLLVLDPSGHVAGVIARIDANVQAGGPSHAPAGVQLAGIAGIKGFALAISERLDAGPLRLAYINRLTSFPSYGNVVYGGYTGGGAAVTADERLIQVIRAVQFVKASLEPGLQREIWENFSPNTQARVQASIESFLRNNSYLFPAGLAESDQFKVISIEPTQNELDEGLLRVRVQLRTNKAVRFIEIALEYPIPTEA